MPMTLVSTVGLVSASASIDFLDIPQTGKDLLILLTARNSSTNQTAQLRFNNTSTTTNWERTHIAGNGDVAATNTGADSEVGGVQPTSAQTADTFGSTKIYIMNYASSTPKYVITETVTEANTSTGVLARLIGHKWNNTDAVTRVDVEPAANNFVALTTCSLYIIS